MKYYFVPDFGIKVEASSIAEVYRILGGRNRVIKANGGVKPGIFEITLDDYLLEDEFDVI